MNWYKYLRQNRLLVLAKDVPLNWSVWQKQQMTRFEWIKKVAASALEGDAHIAMFEYAALISKIRDEDRYAIDRTEYGYMWDGTDVDPLFRYLRSYFDYMEAMYFYLSDGKMQTALSRVADAHRYLEMIEWYKQGFVQSRDAGYETLREYAGEEGTPLSVEDLQKFTAVSRKIAKWFGDFANVEASRKATIENLETMVEWGGREGPADRTKVDKLYHTTVAAADIEKNGFQADAEVKGLGGSTDGMLSTTLSKKVAVGIADGLKGIIMLANGRTGMESIRARAKKAGVWDEMMTWNFGAMGMLRNLLDVTKDEDGAIAMIDKGYVPYFPYGMDMPAEDELPIDAIPIQTEKIGSRRLVRLYWSKDKRLHDDFLKTAFQVLLSVLDSSGKGYNPVFFGVDLENFRGLDVGNVGIFELEVDMSDPKIKYVAGMYEYRVPVEAIKSIHRVG